MSSDKLIEGLQDKANKLRIHSIRTTTKAGSGHPTTCLSAADIVSALFFHTMRYDPHDPTNPNNDRFVLSKGHAAPLLYAAYAEAGAIPIEKLDSLEGRMEVVTGLNNSIIIDDTYDGKTKGFSEALQTVNLLPARRRIVVLGEMLADMSLLAEDFHVFYFLRYTVKHIILLWKNCTHLTFLIRREFMSYYLSLRS